MTDDSIQNQINVIELENDRLAKEWTKALTKETFDHADAIAAQMKENQKRIRWLEAELRKEGEKK